MLLLVFLVAKLIPRIENFVQNWRVPGGTFNPAAHKEYLKGEAYLARYDFDSQLAFYGVLAFDALMGAVVYKLTLDSAVSSSERGRERMIAALSQGDGPIAA